MPNFDYEKKLGHFNGTIICGVDEAGRGPLAGPVTAAATILRADLPSSLKKDIRDSKKMSPQARENIFVPIQEFSIHAVAEASVEEISSLNILWASMLAMKRAIEGLATKPDIALIDGNRLPKPLSCRAVAIVEGDDKSLSIAAASILAKVTRDRLMKKLAAAHPGYGWERNFGYGTPEHLKALKQLGPTGWHRCSFAPVYQASLLSE